MFAWIQRLPWFSAFPLASLMLAAAVSIPAQTATNTVIAIGPSAQGIVQAPDGNFYAPSLKAFEACQADATKLCANIYKITPAGVMSVFSAFDPVSTSSSVTASSKNGLWPVALLVGIDGNLYGACRYYGPSGFGTIFQIPLTGPTAGQINVLASFGSSATGLDPGASPTSLIQTADGSFLFTNGIGIYKLVVAATGNSVTEVFKFKIDPKTLVLTQGGNAASLVEGSDGDLYMPLWTGPQVIQSDGATGAIGDLNPISGAFFSYPFPADGSKGAVPDGPLAEGPDGQYYGVTRNHALAHLMAFKVSSTGTITPLHSFTDTANGGLAQSALIVGSDDNLYGTTLEGGATGAAGCSPTGCGTIFQLTPGGTLTTLHQFTGGTPTSTVVADNPQVDGAVPEAPLVQGNDGNFYGTSLFDVVYKTALTPALSAPVQLTFSKTTVGTNTSTTLSWQVLNAYSKTDQVCGATVQGGVTTGIGNWTGLQTGTLANGIYSGSAVIKPTVEGTYTYALTCGGKETGFATLKVIKGFVVTTIALPDATVNKSYNGSIAVFGGTPQYTWLVSNMPAGLTINSLNGAITGIPKQFGDFVLDVTVLDSATPTNKTTGLVSLSVLSGLEIKTTAAIKGTVGADYHQPLLARGGLPPYQWSLTAGKLPDGLQLYPGTGAIDGKPTTVGSSTVTLQVQDNEANPATETVDLTFKIVPSIQIAAVEFTQAIQQYQVLDDLTTSLTNDGEPPVPIISGKFAAMRVYFTNLKDATDVVLQVSGATTGQRAMNLPPQCPPDFERIHQNMCPSMDFYFMPPPGQWSVTLTLNDDAGNQLEQETLTVNSRDTKSVHYKGVSICSVPGQPSSCQSPDGLGDLLWFGQKILPTNSITQEVIPRKVYRDPTKFVARPGVTAKQAWEESLVDGMNAYLYTPADAQADANLNQFTDYAGVYNNAIDQTGMGLRPGHALVIPNQTNRQGLEATAQVFAHETGHTLDLPHTGKFDPHGTKPGSCWGPGVLPNPPFNNEWIYADNYIRSFGNGYEYGFDPEWQQIVAGERRCLPMAPASLT